MRMQFRQICSIVTLVLLVCGFLWNCGDRPVEKTKPPIVSKKIAVPEKPAAVATDEPALPAPSPKESDAAVLGQQAASPDKRIYDPAKRLDPFIPLYRAEQTGTPIDQPDKSKRKKRTPQTPLERISLDQLQLRAIIRAASGNRALVEDSSGKGYIIKNGTYVGLNSGIVTQISPDGVIVEEEVENLMGELVLQNTVMKLQKPAGE